MTAIIITAVSCTVFGYALGVIVSRWRFKRIIEDWYERPRF